MTTHNRIQGIEDDLTLRIRAARSLLRAASRARDAADRRIHRIQMEMKRQNSSPRSRTRWFELLDAEADAQAEFRAAAHARKPLLRDVLDLESTLNRISDTYAESRSLRIEDKMALPRWLKLGYTSQETMQREMAETVKNTSEWLAKFVNEEEQASLMADGFQALDIIQIALQREKYFTAV